MILERANTKEYEQSERLTLPTVFQDANSLADVSQVEGCLVVTAHVLPDLSCKQRQCQLTTRRKNYLAMWRTTALLTYLHHLAQFCQVSGDEVEEREFVEVLGPLVAHFHHLVVPLEQCRLSQSLPAAAFIQGLGSLQSHLGRRDETLWREVVRVYQSVAQASTRYLKPEGWNSFHLNVATFQSQAEASLLIFHKM